MPHKNPTCVLKQKFVFLACFVTVIFCVFCSCSKENKNSAHSNTDASVDSVVPSSNVIMGTAELPLGSDEIYPLVMVNNSLYAWTMDGAIKDYLPNEAFYYGKIMHTEGIVPTKNGEFTSVFDVSGSIYTISEDPSVIYLVLTTEWLENTVVTFKIYPVILVNDSLYMWDVSGKMHAELPVNSCYYGEIAHTKKTIPTKNREFSSVFDASGTIYTIPEDPSIIYLLLTTEWIDNILVAFHQMDMAET